MRCIEFPRLFFSEFQISESEFQFLNFSTAEFEKNFPTGIFGIENRMGIPLPMGVPEIRTKNWNSQPSYILTVTIVSQKYRDLSVQVEKLSLQVEISEYELPWE